jgi:hypothetical protein
MTRRERAFLLLAVRRAKAGMRRELHAMIGELDAEISDVRSELHEAQRQLGQLRLLDMSEADASEWHDLVLH